MGGDKRRHTGGMQIGDEQLFQEKQKGGSVRLGGAFLAAQAIQEQVGLVSLSTIVVFSSHFIIYTKREGGRRSEPDKNFSISQRKESQHA